MFGQESEAYQRFRAQQKAQYAADLKKQIEDQAKKDVRQTVVNQILQNPKAPIRQIQILQRNRYNPSLADAPIEKKEIPIAIQNIPESYNVQSEEPPSSRRYQEPSPKKDISPPVLPNNDAAIQNLQLSIDRIVSIDLPNRIKPCEDAISNLNIKIERSITSNSDQIQNLKDKFSEISLSINNLSRKINENSDKIRYAITEIQQDNQKLRDTLSATNSRVQNLEGYMSKLEETFNTISMRQGMLEQSVAQSIEKLQQTITGVSTSSQAGDQHIMSQLESLNKQTINAFLQANNNIQTLSNSISSLTNDVKSSFTIVRKEFDDALVDMTQKTQNATLENAQAFQTLQDEVVDTFVSLQGVIEKSNKAMEEAIQREHESRQNDNSTFLEANEIFTTAVAAQLTNLGKAIERTNNNIKTSVETGCALHLGTWRNDMNKFINDTATSVTECQGKMREVENRMAKVSNDNNLNKRVEKLETMINQYESLIKELQNDLKMQKQNQIQNQTPQPSNSNHHPSKSHHPPAIVTNVPISQLIDAAKQKPKSPSPQNQQNQAFDSKKNLLKPIIGEMNQKHDKDLENNFNNLGNMIKDQIAVEKPVEPSTKKPITSKPSKKLEPAIPQIPINLENLELPKEEPNKEEEEEDINDLTDIKFQSQGESLSRVEFLDRNNYL